MQTTPRRLAQYELQGLLGIGGTGEVYRAHDTHLGRAVAIKLLSEKFRHHPHQPERFEREVRAAATLHHPNVVLTLDAGVIDGLPFMVTELLEGNTLRDELESGRPVPVPKVVAIATQIARGLAAAHAHGIVHRDLKPENVVLTDEGVAKIIDFGLARVAEPALAGLADATPSLTEAGAILGTVGYMAPEQVRGLPADHRADIFAVGAILYELLTGRRAFTGPTPADTLVAILSKGIDSQELGEVPPLLSRIVDRCLEKLPEMRFQSAADLAFALEAVTGSSPGGVTADVAAAPSTSRSNQPARWLWSIGLAALVLALAAAGSVLIPDDVPKVKRYTQITQRPLFFPPFPSEYPLVSDGPRIYLTEWVNGHLVVGQIAAAGGELARLPLSLGRDHLVDAMSPDGSEVLVGTPELGKSEEQFYALPLVGGTARRLPDVLGHSTSWLPDGRILYTRGREVFLAARDGTAERLVMTLPGRAYWLRLSPDGTLLRFTLFREGVRHTSIWEARVDGSGLRQLLQGASDLSRECCGEWTPDGRYYLFQATRQNVSHIWALREAASRFTLKTPPAVQLTEGPVQFRRVLPSRDGRKLFAVGWHLHGELSRYDRARQAVVPHLSGLSAEWVAYSSTGDWLAYVTYPDEELWRARADGSQALRLTGPPMRVEMPDWSADGRWIAFTGDDGRAPSAVFVIPSEGGIARRIAPGRSPSWFPDGRSLAYENGGTIRIANVESGGTTDMPAAEGLTSPKWSPDGRHLVAARPPPGGLVLYDVESSRWSDLVTAPADQPVWSPDSRHVYFLAYEGLPRVTSVSCVRLRDRMVKQVAPIADVPLVWGGAGFWLGLTPDEAPLLLRDRSRHDLYALDWRAP